MWYPEALPSFILPGIPAVLQEMSPTCLRIFFKRHRSSDEAVFPNVWSKDHFHQTLTPFQIYQIGISMEWDPWIYSFNKHQRLFWRTVNSEMHCFNCVDLTKGESDSAIVSPRPPGWRQLQWRSGEWEGHGHPWTAVQGASSMSWWKATGWMLQSSESTTHLWSRKVPGSNQQTLEGVGMHPEQWTQSLIYEDTGLFGLR